MRKMKRTFAVFISALLFISFSAGCSSRMKAAMDATETQANIASKAPKTGGSNVNVTFNEDVNQSAAYDSDSGRADGEAGEIQSEAEYSGIRATGYQDTGASLDILAQRKIIRNANLSLEVDDFYHSYGNLQAMLTGIGFVQESNIHRDYYYHEGERQSRISGNITIRIDARHFDYILNDIKGLGDVIDDRIYSNDVTEEFFDTEGRLRILKIEYDYLEEYMRSLKDPDSIFKTRMRMTELQTEIERLTGTLNKWTDLVELSTIYIQIDEKYPEEVQGKKITYWDRLKDSIKNSLTGVIEALGDLLIFIIEIIPTLVLLALFGWVGYRIYKKRIRKKKTPPPDIKDE